MSNKVSGPGWLRPDSQLYIVFSDAFAPSEIRYAETSGTVLFEVTRAARNFAPNSFSFKNPLSPAPRQNVISGGAQGVKSFRYTTSLPHLAFIGATELKTAWRSRIDWTARQFSVPPRTADIFYVDRWHIQVHQQRKTENRPECPPQNLGY